MTDIPNILAVERLRKLTEHIYDGLTQATADLLDYRRTVMEQATRIEELREQVRQKDRFIAALIDGMNEREVRYHRLDSLDKHLVLAHGCTALSRTAAPHDTPEEMDYGPEETDDAPDIKGFPPFNYPYDKNS